LFKTVFLDTTKFGEHKKIGGDYPRMHFCVYGPEKYTSLAIANHEPIWGYASNTVKIHQTC